MHHHPRAEWIAPSLLLAIHSRSLSTAYVCMYTGAPESANPNLLTTYRETTCRGTNGPLVCQESQGFVGSRGLAAGP